MVRHVFALLHALSEGTQPAGVTQLAKRSGLAKTTAHRLLEQLAAEGAVVRRGRQWMLGNALPGTANKQELHAQVVDLVRPRLRDFAVGTGASMFLSVSGGGRLITLDRFYGGHTTSLIPAQAQEVAAAAPASAVLKALGEGQLAVEHGQVHRDFSCLAKGFYLPSGDVAVVSLAIPRERGVERLKQPLDRAVAQLSSEAARQLGEPHR